MAAAEFEGAARQLLHKAVQLDGEKRYMEAKLCYQEGVDLLSKWIRSLPNSDAPEIELKRKKLRANQEQYLVRAEALKRLIDEQKAVGQYSETIHIHNGARGFSYQSVFKRFLDSTITSVEIDDAYIQMLHQAQNFCRFCELLVENCKGLKQITLTTTCRKTDANSNNQQQQQLHASVDNLVRSLHEFSNVELSIVYSDVLHDREIRFSNGWVIKIGRGLDYFQPSPNNMSIGAYNFDLRPCKETTINVYHRMFNKIVDSSEQKFKTA